MPKPNGPPVRRPRVSDDPEPAPGISASELAAKVARLVGKAGGESKALEMVLGENHDYRERHRRDKERITELEGQVPGEGAIVLTGDAAKEYTALQGLKLTAAQITALSTENSTLKTKLEAIDRKKVFTDAAKAVGYNPEVLEDLLTVRGMVIEMKEISVKGDDGKVEKKSIPHVRTSAEGSAFEELTTYAERDLKRYMASLQEESNKNESGDDDGVEFVHQGPADRGSPRTKKPVSDTVRNQSNAQFLTPGQVAAAASK